MASSTNSDLYVLPEMWTTGFAIKPHGIAETNDSSLSWMITAAKKYNAAICGSIAVELTNNDTEEVGSSAKSYRNRHYFVFPDGSYKFYDKHHLFSFGNENRFYDAGKERVIIEYKGVRFLLQTCYDLRFPVWMRYNGDYDAIIFVANWPESRKNVWQILLRARAIENQCYVIGCNRVGKDEYNIYTGESAVIDPKGNTIAESNRAEESVISADISIRDLQLFREKFRVLDDRDIINIQ